MFQPMSLNSKNRTIDNGPNVSKMTFKFEITVPLTAAETRMHQKTAPIVKHRIICGRRRFNSNFMFDWLICHAQRFESVILHHIG